MTELKPALDRLYADFNHPDSATDPIQIVRRFDADDDREIVGFIAAALAFGRVSSVLQSIERVLAVMGPQPAAYVRRFDPARDGAGVCRHRPPLDARADIVALLWVLRQMIDRAGSIEGFFLEGDDAAADDVAAGARQLFDARAGARSEGARTAASRKRAGRLLLLSAAVGGSGLQAAESVSALDGAPRRARSRRLDARVAGAS